jgi:hypothetical protein
MVRGGGYDEPVHQCSVVRTLPIGGDRPPLVRIGTRLPNLGFRCCDDLSPEEQRCVEDAPP